MPEEIKYRIVEFIEKKPLEKFTMKQIKEVIRISYPTLLKWIVILEAEGKIKILDYGNIKLIYLDKKMSEEKKVEDRKPTVCPKCEYRWNTRSILGFISCPNCGSKIRNK